MRAISDKQQVKEVRVRRVGSITAGVSLVLFGILFLLRLFTDVISYEMVFMFWPLIIIGLGVEILISNVRSDNLKYDKGAMWLMVIMMIFATCMAGISEVMTHMQWQCNI